MITLNKISSFPGIILLLCLLVSCKDQKEHQNNFKKKNDPITEEIKFYKGADLSYVNEMLDCGGVFYDSLGKEKDPYHIFKQNGANLIRLRLWHNPDWTDYSDFEDVKRSIKKAKSNKLKVLLDFHYSDTWADPHKQQIPKAWRKYINDTDTLGDLLYNYTFNTLKKLSLENLTPDIVQIGNETNAMILQEEKHVDTIDWKRNAYLLNKGIKAVRDFSEIKGENIEVMLHIAQPENALWWFKEAKANGISNYDWMGLSYYPKWSVYKLDHVGEAFSSLINTYNKKLMIVETAYPFTLEDNDEAGNILGTDALIEGYPATEQGQLNYLTELSKIIFNSGGKGIVYWEPAWISTECSTLWGKVSHWDNATLFDYNNRPNLGMKFFNSTFK